MNSHIKKTVWSWWQAMGWSVLSVSPLRPSLSFHCKTTPGQRQQWLFLLFLLQDDHFLHWTICPFVVLPLLWLASSTPHKFEAVSLWPWRGASKKALAYRRCCFRLLLDLQVFMTYTFHSTISSKPEIIRTLVTTVFLPSKTIEDDVTAFCCSEDTPIEMFHMGVLKYSGTETKKQT